MGKILVTENQLLRLIKKLNLTENKRIDDYQIGIESFDDKVCLFTVMIRDANDYINDRKFLIKVDIETREVLKAKKLLPEPVGFLNTEQIWVTFNSNEELMGWLNEIIDTEVVPIIATGNEQLRTVSRRREKEIDPEDEESIENISDSGLYDNEKEEEDVFGGWDIGGWDDDED